MKRKKMLLNKFINLQELKYFFRINIKQFVLLVIMYLSSCLSIGVVNYPYIDDISRRINGSTTFAEYYSRHLSEYLSWFISGSRHLVDTGLTTYILTAMILALTSILVLFLYHGPAKLTIMETISALFIGLSPWLLEPISFRFDSPFITISILVSILPFLFYKKNDTVFFITSIIGIFLMCNSYQASSGIFPLVLLTYFLLDILEGTTFLRLAKQLAISLSAYIIAMVLFFIEVRLNPNVGNQNTAIATLHEIPTTLIKNFALYFSTLRYQSNNLWLIFFFIIILLFILGKFVNYGIISFLPVIIYITLGAFFSFGAYAFFTANLASDRPRYIYGFAFFLGLLIVQVAKDLRICKFLSVLSNVFIVIIIYYNLSFTYTYATALENQKDSFENQSVSLAMELKNYVNMNSETTTIYINKLFSDSPVYNNTLKNYPILDDLIISNSTIYWPNTMWFNTVTGLNIDFVSFDTYSIGENINAELLVSNYFYDLYRLNNQLYIYMKN